MASIQSANTRSNSQSSVSSTSSIASARTVLPFDLEARATSILTSLCNEPRDFAAASTYIDPYVTVQHEDNEPATGVEEFFQRWSEALDHLPDFHIEVKEACVDEIQRKVWVRSEIKGLPNGLVRESIDMMSFSENGMLTNNIDCQRVKRTP